jgi:hypothetical protein
MACDLLICAKDMHKDKWEEGYINSYNEYPPGKSWRGRDRRPNWVLITVTDAALKDVKPFIAQWHKNYKAEIIDALSVKNTVRVLVNPDCVSNTGLCSDITQKVKDNIIETFSGDVKATDDTLLDVDIDKSVSLEDIERHIHDTCDCPFRTRRMRIKGSIVDMLNASETGQMEMTLAELTGNVESLLDD